MSGVTVEAVAPRAVDDVVEAVGTVRSRRQSVISAKVVATVLAVHAGEGERVRRGQVLVELDDRDVQAQIRKAEAGLREARSAPDEVGSAIRAAERAVEAAQAQEVLAEATYKRYQALLARRSVAPQEYDEVVARSRAAAAEVARAREVRASLVSRREQAQARVAQAEAEVAAVQVGLGYARIAAPADGIVVAKPVEVGNMAAPGVPLLILEEEHYRLEAAVQESEIGKVRLGQTVAVTIDAVGRDLSGPVIEVAPSADPASRTFIVKVDLPAAAGLRSGQYGKVRLPAGQHQAVMVPRQAVVQRGQLEGVFVLEGDNVARLRLVKTGKASGDRIEILSGLAGGERLVVGGVEKVADGSRVEIGG